jgi:fatty acid desaturase
MEDVVPGPDVPGPDVRGPDVRGPDALVSPRDLRALRRLSNRSGVARLAAHLAALAAMAIIVAAAPGPLLRLSAQAVEGAILVFLFAPLHETIHRTAFKSRRLNDVVAAVIGFLILQPADFFRFFHFTHHRHTQDPARDPELATPKPRTRAEWLLAVGGLPLWRDLLFGLLRHAAGRAAEPYLSADAARQVIREARVHVLLYAVLAILSLIRRSDAVIVFWLAPALLGQPWLRLYLMAEHIGCPLVPDMLANSRTTLTNGVVRFFAWNMPFHAEHHAFPAIPFHALPALHDHLAPSIGTLAPGYIAVHARLLRTLA